MNLRKNTTLKITVIPEYQEALSSADEYYFVWSYHVYLENNSHKTLQLINRYWQIFDTTGQIQKIKGSGIVGQQPILRPKEIFEYISHAQLSTPSGIMIGSYEVFDKDDNVTYEVDIPAFSLDNPNELILPN